MPAAGPTAGPAASPTAGPAGEWRQRNIGRLLNIAVVRFETRVLEILAQRGFADVRLTHVSVTRNLDTGGTRLTELAARAQMTKQSMGELVDQCVALGIVRREPDPHDRRAKILHFTAHGLAFLEGFRLAVAEAQGEMGLRLGEARMQVLLHALWDYTRPEG